jgi:predicted nucleic acid-binding protein
MARKIFDTSALIQHWHDSGGRSPAGKTPADAAAWAQRLIAVHDTDAIVTPVFVEFVAGVTNSVELELTRAFLNQFRLLDEGRITSEDWEETLRLAQRVPPNRKPRHLGDCLIAAIGRRLHYEVIRFDRGFPR